MYIGNLKVFTILDDYMTKYRKSLLVTEHSSIAYPVKYFRCAFILK